MTTPVFNLDKSLQAVLYIGDRLKSKDFHKIFKVLYFADREHVAKYGRFITGDTYIRMQYGPVPSGIYDILKHHNEYRELYEIKGHYVHPKRKADLRKLSGTDIAELNASIDKYGDLSMNVLTEMSHGYAWNSAAKNGNMSVEDILKEAGAEPDYIDYICRYISLQKSC